MSRHVFRVDAECSDCSGTGLYVGMAEINGAAIQCGSCNGQGHRVYELSYNDFKGRKKRVGVRRVFQCNPGIVVGDMSYMGGVTYDTWRRGSAFGPGTEMRSTTCPAWWFQTADYQRKPEWQECSSLLGCRFSDCPHFATKDRCWQRFDKEGL